MAGAATNDADPGTPVSVDAFRDTFLLRAMHEAVDLAEELGRIHKNPGHVTSPEQLDEIDAISDKLNDHVRHGTAQVRRLIANASAATAVDTAATAAAGGTADAKYIEGEDGTEAHY